YKGSFRSNIVVIKKMKSVLSDNGSIEEFEKEVAMLDKFRCEYIVHFYGAVFIPNKMCMVTEFAQFGSLHDLIKHKTSDEVNMNVRVKFMLDAARGILYLHTNEILHRDIKPDNILVFTLDLNDNVNAKLTDFGSSRNVNMLLTNMTFTNGIGTPVYMAPEVLKMEKYKKPADIYSFAITMFEVFGWSQAYLIDTFKFAWKIAEFVSSGERLENRRNIPETLFQLIVKFNKIISIFFLFGLCNVEGFMRIINFSEDGKYLKHNFFQFRFFCLRSKRYILKHMIFFKMLFMDFLKDDSFS
ncbi:protein kinase, putative, partial [Entamoeba invadens IP1]